MICEGRAIRVPEAFGKEDNCSRIGISARHSADVMLSRSLLQDPLLPQSWTKLGEAPGEPHPEGPSSLLLLSWPGPSYRETSPGGRRIF